MTESSSPIGFVAPEPSDLTPLFPGYEIHDLVATGGMGAVYRAVQKSLDRTVALKILPLEFSEDAEFCAGFEAEAKAMARLNHPNLIGVHDFGEVNGMLFIVMEFVPGKSIYHSASGQAIDPGEVIRLVTGICNGLAHAHENGILHRDIKPSNILLTPQAEPKIGDFGLARPVESKTQAGEVIFGTPGYTAPEVVNAPDTVDHRADLFSVGVLLHELLTGKLPADDPRPASLISGCDVRFDAMIHRATNPVPEYRYSSAAEIAGDLQKMIAPPVTTPMGIARGAATGGVARPHMPRRATNAGVKRKPMNLSWVGPLLAIAIMGYSWHLFANMKPRVVVIDDPARPVGKSVSPGNKMDVEPQAPEPTLPPAHLMEADAKKVEVRSDSGQEAAATPIKAALEYGLFVKGAWVGGKDGSVAGDAGSGGAAGAMSVSGVPFPAEFRLHLAKKGWLGWVPCDGRQSSGEGRNIEAIQFRFPAGVPDGIKLYGRVHVEGVGWLKTVAIEHCTVLGTTRRYWPIDAIQISSKAGEVGSAMDLVEQSDAGFNLLLPPGSPPVPKAETNRNPASGLGWWQFSGSSDEFMILPDGNAFSQTRPPGKWTCQAPGNYQISWENGKWVDTMELSGDGSLMRGQNQTGAKMIFARVDGLSQIRSGGGSAPKSGIIANRSDVPLTKRESPAGVPKDARFFNGKWYLVFQDTCSWKGARGKCQMAGGQLVVITNAATQAFITELASGRMLWLGATDEEKEGVWLWMDGTEMKFRNFSPGEPNNHGGAENYLVINYRNNLGTWNDANDDKQDNEGYICEWEEQGVPHGDRIWIQAGTGKTINATLVSKSPDNSKVTLMITGSKKAITAASDTFSPKDREYISRWEPPSQKRIASSPASREVKGEEPPQGLVLPPPTVLEQGKGGFGIQIDELGQILKPYAVPENDLAAHPEMTIYSGSSPSGGGNCTITYLMKRDKAVELLLGRAGLSLKLKAVAPGFPPGLSIYNYDRKFWDYDHLTLVVDAADQVVTLQFKSDTKAFGYLDGKWPYFNFRTLNFINLKVADGVRIQVRGRKDGNEPVVVNSDHRRFNETVTWFVPKPLVRLILFNVQEKQKTGRR